MTTRANPKSHSFYYAVGMVFYLVCQWLTTVIVTRMDLTSGGILTLAIAVTNPFSAIALFTMRAYQVSDIDNRFSSRTYVTARLLTMLFSLALCVSFTLMNGYTGVSRACILLYMGLRLCEALVDVFQGIEQKTGHLDMVGRSFIARGLASTIGFFSVFVATHYLPLALLAMAACSLVVVVVYDIRICRRFVAIKPQFDWRALGQLALACLPLTINSFLVSRIGTLPSTTLEAAASHEIVGIYGALNAPCIIVQTAGSFIFNPLIPHFAEKIKNRQKQSLLRQFFKSILIILSITLVCTIGSWLLGEWGLTLLFGKDVAAYAFLLPQMVLVSGFITLTWFCALQLTILRYYAGLLITNFFTLIVTSLACQYLITQGGLVYAPASLAVGIAFQAALYGYFLWRKYHQIFADKPLSNT